MRTSSRRTPALAVALAAAALAVACGGADRWTGAVDAVFRYRPADHSTVVHRIRPESASEAAGMQPGDRILAVDGEDVTDLSFEAVRAALRGPVGTRATLTVERGDRLLEIAVERMPTRSEE